MLELVLSGDLDMQNAEELERYLTGGFARGCDIDVDLTDVRMIDCVCLNVLVQGAHAAGAAGCALRLLSPSPLVRMTMRFTGTESIFVISGERAG